MARPCTICTHPKRTEIDAALLGTESFRIVSDRFRISKSSVMRHADSHIPKAIARAAEVIREGVEVARAVTMVEKVRGLEEDARRIGRTAEKLGDLRVAIVAIKQVVDIVDLMGRVVEQEAKRGGGAGVSAEALDAAFLPVYEAHPEARPAILRALARLAVTGQQR